MTQLKTVYLCQKGDYRIYVDTEGTKTYLSVIEFLKPPSDYTQRFTRYEILCIDPDSDHVQYILPANQFCIFYHKTKTGMVCEERMDGFKCVTFGE